MAVEAYVDIVIASAARTPIGSFLGSLSSVPVTQLGAVSIAEAIRRAAVPARDVDLVLMGNVVSAGVGQAPARQAALRAGLSSSTPTVTVNKLCGSGMETIVQAARAVTLGDHDVVVAGGMESMSRAPYLLPGARAGLRLGEGALVDSLVHDGLWDAFEDRHMGSCAEACVAEYALTREDQDAFAERSYRRAQEATVSGIAAREIVAVDVPGRKGTVVVDADEGPSKADFARMPTLRPAFGANGTITAANASTLNDGAAATVITSARTARERGYGVQAIVHGWAVHAQEPLRFASAPVEAIRKVLDRVGWSPNDVDRYEINEAFAAVPLAAMRAFDLDASAVNVFGGAVALGHPIGASGTRIVVTLLNALHASGGGKGVAAVCIGGGEAWALAVETVDAAA